MLDLTTTPSLRRQRRIRRATVLAYRIFCVLNIAGAVALALEARRTLVDGLLIVAAVLIIVAICRSEEYAWTKKSGR